MKKLLIVIAVALFSFTATAQGVNFGVKAGVNLASINGDDAEDYSGLTSFHAGVVAEIPISDQFSFQPELVYSAQGAELSGGGDTSKYKLDYLNIPLMAKYEVTQGLNLEAGPQIGFLLSAKDEFDEFDESGEEDIKEFFNSIDFGVGVGINYAMETGLNFGARYNLGISDINDGFELSTLQNGVFQISVGYLFGSSGGNN